MFSLILARLSIFSDFRASASFLLLIASLDSLRGYNSSQVVAWDFLHDARSIFLIFAEKLFVLCKGIGD